MTSEMKSLVNSGWQWQVVKSDVEKLFPTFPTFSTMAMNSHNSNAIAGNELEVMMQLASAAGVPLNDACSAVESSAPSCQGYLSDVAYFMKMFMGGSDFPMLLFLDSFSHQA